ncbi:MAG: glycosyltransferase, partial [Candidatus Riesia sp.]|nr:glycosyltransferase [Candidatus Riesia sp.]
DFIEKSQLYLCGFDLRIRTPKGIIKSNPNSNQWKFFEDIFTNNGKWVKNSEYRKFLNEYKDDNYGISEEFRNSEFYQRRWTKPILTYGTMYHESDVVLAPLKNNNIFNMYKSQLKVIEAGVYKCPIIASRYGPYTLDIEDGVDGFLIDEDKPHLWYDKMRWFVKNPSAVKDMGERLYEKVVSKYEMGVVTEKRVDCYKKILE